MLSETLVTQLKKGNQLAFTSIYKTYGKQAYLLAYKYLCNKEMAEDAVQNLFLKLWNNHENIDDELPIQNYLFTILKRDLLNTLRDKKNVCVLDDCIEVLNFIDGSDMEVEDLKQEQIELFKRAIEQLSPQRKQIFVLKVTGKYSNLQIAEKLNLSVNTIKFQYSQALRQVKTIINDYAVSIILLTFLN